MVKTYPAFGSEVANELEASSYIHHREHPNPLTTPPPSFFPPMSDSELRQRQPSPTTSAMASPKKQKGSNSPPPSNPPPASTVTRGFILAASFALSVTILLCLHTFHSPSPVSTYILCSPPGTRQIYTVDHDDSKLECMAVRGDLIVDTGARGVSHEPIILFRTLLMGHFPQPTSQTGIHHTN